MSWVRTGLRRSLIMKRRVSPIPLTRSSRDWHMLVLWDIVNLLDGMQAGSDDCRQGIDGSLTAGSLRLIAKMLLSTCGGFW